MAAPPTTLVVPVWGNPYRDDVRVITLSGWPVSGPDGPLRFVALDGNEIEDDWNVQKPTEKSGATAVWRGTKIVEGLVTTFEAPDEASFDGFASLWAMMAPGPGGMPNLSLGNPLINAIGVDRVSRRKWKGPYESKGLSWRVDCTWIQYRPPAPAKTGPQAPAKPNDPTAPTPASAAEQEFKSLAQKAGLL